MPDSTEIHGDQKNITVFGFSAPWVVGLVAVVLICVIGVIVVVAWAATNRSNNGDSSAQTSEEIDSDTAV